MVKILDKNNKEIGKLTEKMEIQKKAAFESISKKAILVDMSRKQIANLPFDVKLTNEVCKNHGIKNNSYIQIRKCIFNPQYLTNIRSLVNDALLMVWNTTRPWDNVGFRLLSMEFYDDFNNTFNKIKDKFEEAKKEFISNFDNYVIEAKKDLGTAFNKADYPDKDKLDDLFELKIVTSKFPDIEDIRLNLTNDELLEMQNDIVDKYEESINISVDELFKLIENTEEKDNVEKQLNIIKCLNIENNADLNMKISTAEEKAVLKFGKFEKNEKKVNESMMIIDDLDDFDDNSIDEFNV